MLFLSIQSNNTYIFPGLGLGLVMSGAIRVHDDMLLAAGKFKAYQEGYYHLVQQIFSLALYVI